MSFLLNTLSASLQTRIRKLSRKKYRTEFGEFLLEGARLVTDALQTAANAIRFVVVSEERREHFRPLSARCSAAGIAVYSLQSKDFAALCDTEHTQGILAVATIPAQPDTAQILENSIVTVLHEVSDPGNLGTVIRTGDWFGATDFLLSPNSADPWNTKAVRASMGSILRARTGSFSSYDELLQLAANKGFTAFAADAGGSVSLYECAFPERTLLLFGSEAHGLPQELLQRIDTIFRIPQFGSAESLNLAISHAATMTELRRQRP